MLRLFCSLGILFCLSFTYGSAAVYTWNGSEDSDWFNINNWDTGVPSSADTAIIAVGLNFPLITIGQTVNVRRLVVQTGSILQISPISIFNTKTLDNSGHIIAGGPLQFSTVFSDALVNQDGGLIEIQPGGKLFFAEVLGVCFTNLAGA